MEDRKLSTEEHRQYNDKDKTNNNSIAT